MTQKNLYDIKTQQEFKQFLIEEKVKKSLFFEYYFNDDEQDYTSIDYKWLFLNPE